MLGTMIEIPRAALLADQIAEVAEFFSFGTNDLTQMTLGLSRDDAGRFVPTYVASEKDGGVGICGEHGGESASVKFCHKVGMNYVSCSPYRVPIARLAAAQAAIADKVAKKK